MVCDVAIGCVQADLSLVFGDRVRFTPVHGEGTLIEAEADVDADRFETLARAAIAAAQEAREPPG